MFLKRLRAMRTAREIARRLGGTVEPVLVTFSAFETARVMVRARFEGMHLRVYVCVPWIHVEDRGVAGPEHATLALAVNAPRNGLSVPAAGLSLGARPVYVEGERGLVAAETFCRDPATLAAVTALDLGPGEWLLVTHWQLWLRCRAGDVDTLIARLNPLARLHARVSAVARSGS